jgi:hypothetical protein
MFGLCPNNTFNVYIIVFKLLRDKMTDEKVKKASESKNKLSNIKILKDVVPDNIKFSLEPTARDTEDVCAKVMTLLKTYSSKYGKILEFPKLVAKTMEFVETFNKLTGKEKKLVATRCVAEMLWDMDLEEDTKKDLMLTIPGTIEAIINLSKGQNLNNKITSSGIVEKSYVVKRSFERIVDMLREKNYDANDILANIYLIVQELMFIVGSYPTLSSSDKKEIVIEVLNKIINEYILEEFGLDKDNHIIVTILDNLPKVIDVLASVSKNEFLINTITEIASKGICFCC